ncbi:MAG: acyltransferase [Muribaculaceae bacterium]|nr:acyltransferase [Muribaculaceae bacterium]
METVISTKTDISKPRYELLDGLRGVAALMVIWYHFGEGFATSAIDQWTNHGYLAVDFFFVLSGFVLGYAYNDRWKQGLTPWRFMLRRVIRLQPMVVMGVTLGAIAYLIQGSVHWDGTPVAFHWVAVSLVMGLLLLPVWPGFGGEVRGNGEMFPLNGPSWSLFFEYIGSFLYGIWLHRLSRKALTAVVIISGIGLGACVAGNLSGSYHQGIGWSIADYGFLGGFMRLSFSFSAGLLMSRTFRPRRIRGAFWICSALIVAALSCPYIGSTDGMTPSVWNGVYDIACTWALFPAIVYIGACGTTTDHFSSSACEALGRLSYPIYIIHYPLMYLFYAWVWGNGVSVREAMPVCAGIFAAILLLAWVATRFYDEPVRRWLSDRLLQKR